MSKPGPGVWPECFNESNLLLSNHPKCKDLVAANTGGGVLGESNHRVSLPRRGANTPDSTSWKRIHSFPDCHNVQLWDVLYIYFFFYHNSYIVILMSNAMFLSKLITCFG